jgi:putative aminopeptidase FrvX
MDIVQLLRDLSQASGVSGFEDGARAVVHQAFAPYADTVRGDALGNLIALRKGQRAEGAPVRSIMLAAHMDEIGLMVTGIEEGFVRFTHVGGVDLRTILGQEVLVHGSRPMPGIIGTRPPHVLPAQEMKKPVPLDKLFIDVGLPADNVAALVHVGDVVTLRRDMLELAEPYVSGKGLDDRAGVVTLAICLEILSTLRHEWDVYAVATTQEEVGLRGAIVSAYGIAPDIAIAVDVGFGAQQGVNENESIAMDEGPSVAMGPNIHPAIHERLVKTAQEYEIPHQLEVAPGATGTDAWALQVTRQGVPSGLLSLPLRYMHTTVETACTRDLGRTGRLMALFIAGLREDFATKLGPSDQICNRKG